MCNKPDMYSVRKVLVCKLFDSDIMLFFMWNKNYLFTTKQINLREIILLMLIVTETTHFL